MVHMVPALRCGLRLVHCALLSVLPLLSIGCASKTTTPSEVDAEMASEAKGTSEKSDASSWSTLGHLPRGCVAVINVHWDKLRKNPVFGREIVPRIVSRFMRGAGDDAAVEAFRSTTNISLETIRQFSFCFRKEGADLGVVGFVSAEYNKGSLLPALQSERETKPTTLSLDGVTMITLEDDLVVAELSPKVIGVGQSAKLVRMGIRQGDGASTYRLNPNDDIGIAFDGSITKDEEDPNPIIERISAGQVSVNLSERSLIVRLESSSPGESKELEGILLSARDGMLKKTDLAKPMREALQSAKTSRQGDAVTVVVRYPPAAIEAVVQAVAAEMDAPEE